MAIPRKVLSSTSAIGATAIAGAGLAWYTYSSYNAAASAASSKTTFPASGFVPLTLADSHFISPNVKQLRFKLPEGHVRSGLPAISSLITQSKPANAWLPVWRPYTPISTADDPAHITFLIKQYPNGKASTHLHSLLPGQTLSVRYIPTFLHEFDYTPNRYSHLTLVAGGAGITPMLQLLRTAFADDGGPRGPSDDTTTFSLVYANKREADILLKDELDALARKWPRRFRVRYVLSDGPDPGAGAAAAFDAGYISKEMLRGALLPPRSPARDGADERDSKVLVCGPPPMIEAVAGKTSWFRGGGGGLLGELGVDASRVVRF